MHQLFVVFAVLLGLSLCGVVAAILWLVVHRGHRLVARDLIPVVGFTLSGLISLGLVAISTASAPPRHRTQPTATGTITPRPGPSPTASRTYRAPPRRLPAVPVHHPATATRVATTHRSATATPRPSRTTSSRPSSPATPRPTATIPPSPTSSATPRPSATPSPTSAAR